MVHAARFAPDGKTIIYSAAWEGKSLQLFTTRPESPESHELEPAGADVLAVSSSGEMALSLRSHPSAQFLYSGTWPACLWSAARRARSWRMSSGRIGLPMAATLAIVRQDQGRHRLEFPPGKLLYEADGWIGHIRISPKADVIAFIDHPQLGDDGGAVAMVDLAGKKTTLSTGWDSIQGIAWSPPAMRFGLPQPAPAAIAPLCRQPSSATVRLFARVPGELTLLDVDRDGQCAC